MKRFIAGLVVGAMIFGSIAALAVNTLVAHQTDFTIYVDGARLEIDTPVVTIEGRTYLPARALGEALGMIVTWDEAERQVRLTSNGIGLIRVEEGASFWGDDVIVDEYRNEPMGIDLSTIGQGNTIPLAAENIWVRGYGGEPGSVLPPREILAFGDRTPLPHGTSGAWLSNIGIVNGQLRIQNLQYFSIEFGTTFALIAPNGDVIYPYHTVDVWLNSDLSFIPAGGLEYPNRPTYRVTETIFAVNVANLANYTLVFDANIPRHYR
ncbi:MAG: copper amine oxidase N-terminal domain-containing protein [Oscillospiraceae bacterium]|nr:copper amine oxidase N-terminal domain-containing protein [Oscillospiraceae bacterium]